MSFTSTTISKHPLYRVGTGRSFSPCITDILTSWQLLMKKRDYLPERRIKRSLQKYLASRGWSYYTDMITSRSVDIKANRGEENWIIEIKRSESLNTDIVASFVSVIGKIVQIMDDENCKYSIALPDKKQFRRLWERLPELAKERTGITALFVNNRGDIHETN